MVSPLVTFAQNDPTMRWTERSLLLRARMPLGILVERAPPSGRDLVE
jgi:hypothetical protein